MSDEQTLAHYEREANTYLKLYSEVELPHVEALIKRSFHPGGLTLDIGCASGRDLARLQALGFKVEGLDAVQAFVTACRERFPELTIHHDRLPELAQMGAHKGRFDNLLLSAVLMHLPAQALPLAFQRFASLLKPQGRALLSVRCARSPVGEVREGERLFTPLSLERLRELCEQASLKVLSHELRQEPDVEALDGPLMGKRWLSLVVERG